MIEPYRTLFSKLPRKTQDELHEEIKKLSHGFSGQIRHHVTKGVIADTNFLVGTKQLRKPFTEEELRTLEKYQLPVEVMEIIESH